MTIRDILRHKRDGGTLDRDAIVELVAAMADGSAGDEQLGAFAMAVYLNGMEDGECAELTRAMRDSGRTLQWESPALPGPVLDKHSTGGIGDVTSLLIAPIVAACGGFVPMIAGRGLGHTGGTIDKLASIPGYDVALDPDALEKVVREVGCAIVGQTRALAPADRRLYAVRDVTATVESVPLIVASILSKKLAEGLDGLVLDVKTGSGAVMVDHDRARHLARRLTEVGNRAGVRTRALLTDMSQPLADSAGNALEILEVIDCLRGRPRRDSLLRLSRELSAEMLLAGGLADDAESARQTVDAVLDDGRAAERFAAMVRVQGGPSDLLERPEAHLPRAPVTMDVHPDSDGHIESIDAHAVGMAVVALGGGRRRAEDDIDPAVGLTALVQVGDAVDANRPLARVHARNRDDAERAAAGLRSACRISDQGGDAPPLILERLAPEVD